MTWSQAHAQTEDFMLVSGSAKSLFRYFRRSALKYFVAVSATLFAAATAHAQPKIVLSDLFTKTNLYWRAYANKYDPSDTSASTAFSVPTGLIGDAGTNSFWDFSKGPTNEVLRFDYISPDGLAEAADFPSATIVEQETLEGATDAKPVFLFFEPVAGTGRTVYGAYADSSANSLFGTLGLSMSPSMVFDPPIVDFPDPITYGAQWSTTTSYMQDVGGTDPTDDTGFSASIKTDASSDFTADAYGTIVLPDELPGSFAQGLRVTEQVTYNISMDNGDGTFQQVETDYTRNYYWFVPGYGMVAQLNSLQGSAPVPEKFTRATAFLRMFETNKKITTTGGGGCTDPDPVSDLKIRVSNGVVLLTWSQADCANQYVVQYTSTPTDPQSWQPLGDATANLVWQGENTSKGPARFYRVVSLK